MARGMTIGLLLALAAAGGIGWRLMRSDLPLPPRTVAEPQERERPVRAELLAGSASCGGRSCHGSIETAAEKPVGRNEYTLWMRHDPHGRAYQALFEPASQDMAERLQLGKAHEAPLCLSCHLHPLAGNPAHVEAFASDRHLGMSCEACHGSAAKWLEPHVAAGWRERTANEKQTFGLVALGDKATLARACANCHIGSATAEVTHDLIAAGHPRLAFELSSYFATLPPHWQTKPVREGHLWALGQVIGAERSLELTKQRAESATATWPELADYDCFACHHDLTEPSWRQQQKPGRPGAMRWGTWYFALPSSLARDLAPHLGLEASIAQLREVLARPHAARKQTAAQAEVVVGQLKTLAEKLHAWQDTPAYAQARIDFLRRQDAAPSWDEVEQRFLALEALNQVAEDAALRKKLREALPWRALPLGLSSPLSRPEGGFRPDELTRLLGTRP